MKRSLVVLAALAVVLPACGSGRPSPPAVAVVNDQPIPRSEYRQYVLYAGRFFAAAGQGRCPGNGAGCGALERQVLRRLLEQRVVEQYAGAHHIALSASERRQIDAQVAIVTATGTPAGKLLSGHEVSRAFIHSILTDELLVQKVEHAVVPTDLDRGRSYRLRIVTVSIGLGGEKPAFRAALDLATSGGAAPAGATDRTEWVAAFRLGTSVQTILSQAQVGQYVGPFQHGDSFRDFQLLGRKWGRYGRPARQRLETAYFRGWLNRQLSAAHPACYAGTKPAPCPGANA